MSFFPRLRARKGTGATFTEPRISFIEGDGIGITLTDVPEDEVQVEISATAGLGDHTILSTEHTDTDYTDTPADGDVLTWDNYLALWIAAPPPTGGSLTVEEIDAAPSVSGVTTIRVSNGTLTDDGGGQVTIDTAGTGGTTSLDPDDVTNLEQWVSGDTIGGLSDGDPVGTWSDQSGNARDFTQATGANKPSYQTNELNGLPIVRFDNSNDGMGSSYSPTAPFTIAVIYKYNSGGTSAQRRVVNGANNWLMGPYTNRCAYYNGQFAYGPDPRRWHIQMVMQDESAGVNIIDGVSWDIASASSVTAPGNLGLGTSGGFGEQADSDVAELAVWSRFLTRAEVDGLIEGWRTKYAL